MKDSKPLQEKLGEFLRTNKFAIFLEILVVFLPFYLGLAISDRLGSDHVPLGYGRIDNQPPHECHPQLAAPGLEPF
jgi:hypothetical protein